MAEKKRKPWSEEARKNHREGVRRYREELKIFETLEYIYDNYIKKGVSREKIIAALEAGLKAHKETKNCAMGR